MAGTLLHLLTHHSAFMPSLLAGEEAADQLPPQAAQMQVPITSLLPLVEAQPRESQVGAPLECITLHPCGMHWPRVPASRSNVQSAASRGS